MKKVFIIHGFMGTPNGGWKSWLMNELAKQGIYACSLPMPVPNKPIKNEWVSTIREIIGTPNEEIFLVGHSLGVPTILRYLETLNNGFRIGGAVLVSGPFNSINREGYGDVNKFLESGFDFKKIKNGCERFAVIHGVIDKWVPFSDAEYLSDHLSCDLISIPDGGHLSPDEKCFELPQALEALLKMINK